MFVEKKRLGIPPRLLTANGDNNGTVTLADTRGFFVGQIVELSSDTQQARQLKVKRFVSKTTFKVGPVDSGVNGFTSTSDFLVSDNAIISASEQNRPGITDDDYNRAVYAEEPIVAKRTIMVDEFGNYYNDENPLPINAEFSGSLSVDLDGFSPTDPDSVQITGSEDGTKTGTKRGARVDSDLDLRVGISDGLNKAQVDALRRLSVFDENSNLTLSDILARLNGTLDVSALNLDIRDLNSNRDDVAISFLGNFLSINSDGSISIRNAGELTNVYGEVLGVAAATPTTVATYTSVGESELRQVSGSGTNIARYTVLLNGNPIDRQYTNFGANNSVHFFFDKGVQLLNGDVVTLQVLHNRPYVGDFNGKIIAVI